MQHGATPMRQRVPWYLWPLAPFALLAAMPVILPIALLALVSIPLRMRFHLGAIPSSPDFTPGTLWKSLGYPSPWMEKLVVFPIGIVAAVLVAVLWLAITPLQAVTPTMSLPGFLVAFAGIAVVHELLHAAVYPRSGRSPHSTVGFWPSGVMFYAHYDGELTRNRFLAVLLMPLVVISFVPLLVAAVAQVTCGWVAFISVFHAFLACADILIAGLVLFRTPATAIVRDQGGRFYWREHETLAA
jgi:Putative zincin peptidase